MPADPQNHDSSPQLRRWRWILLTFVVILAIVASAVGYRNQRQWNRVLKFKHQVERAGGNCDIHVRYGTDFWRIGYSVYDSSWRNPITWPTVGLVRLDASEQSLDIDWSVCPHLEVNYLVIFHSQFSDADLEEIPASTPLMVLRLESPSVTNESLAKISQFSTLREISSRRSRIDGTGLLGLAKLTELKLDPSLTTQELIAFKQANLVHRITDFQIESAGDFRASDLKGVRGGGDCAFRGSYDELAFVDVAKFVQKPFVDFERADLQADSFPDIAQMTQVTRLRFTDCTIHGFLAKSESLANSETPLELVVQSTNLQPEHLQAFAGRKMQILFVGETADDAWLDAVMQIPGIEWVKLAQTRVTDGAASKYPFDETYSGQGSMRPFVVKIDAVPKK